MRTTVGNHKYTECGLDNIELTQIPIYECLRCHEHSPSIPSITDLHRLIAVTIALKQPRLTPPELRFLRTYLGYSRQDLINLLQISPEDLNNPNLSLELRIRGMTLVKTPSTTWNNQVTAFAHAATKEPVIPPLPMKFIQMDNVWTQIAYTVG